MASETVTGRALSVLVGVPNAAQRAAVVTVLTTEGHHVVEATDIQEMKRRLDERAPEGFDAIVCAGLLSENHDDPDLAARLANPAVARTLILLPYGGLLSTASRARRLGASEVVPTADDLSGLHALICKQPR